MSSPKLRALADPTRRWPSRLNAILLVLLCALGALTIVSLRGLAQDSAASEGSDVAFSTWSRAASGLRAGRAARGPMSQAAANPGAGLQPSAGSPPQAAATCFVTLGMGDVIVPGVLVLFHSLRKVRAAGDFVALVSGMAPANVARLHAAGIRTYALPPLRLPAMDQYNRSPSMAERDAVLWSKLRVWELVDYAKVVMLDADMLVTQNVDELFALPEYAGAPALHRKEKIQFYKSALYNLVPNNRINRRDPAEADWILPGWSGLNSGVTVLVPSLATFASLLNEISILPTRTCCPSQEFLYNYFEERHKFIRLPPVYNVRALKGVEDKADFRALFRYAKIYHFVGVKPWNQKKHKTFFSKLWVKYAEEAAATER